MFGAFAFESFAGEEAAGYVQPAAGATKLRLSESTKVTEQIKSRALGFIL
jgi:hypothetical protein